MVGGAAVLEIMVVVRHEVAVGAGAIKPRREAVVEGFERPQLRCRKLSRPVCMSRRAGMQGSEPHSASRRSSNAPPACRNWVSEHSAIGAEADLLRLSKSRNSVFMIVETAFPARLGATEHHDLHVSARFELTSKKLSSSNLVYNNFRVLVGCYAVPAVPKTS